MTSASAQTGEFSGVSQSGFVFDGEYYTGEFEITGFPVQLYTDFTATDVLAVSEVVWDEWLYGNNPSSGGISIAIDSPFIKALQGTSTALSGVLIQTGENSYDIENDPSEILALDLFYAGPGDYDVLLDIVASNLTIIPAADNTY
jgi:hypothetical protein